MASRLTGLLPETIEHLEKKGFLSTLLSSLLNLCIQTERLKTNPEYASVDSVLKGMLSHASATPAAGTPGSARSRFKRGSRPSPGSYLGSDRSKYPPAKNDIINLYSNHNAI